MKLKICSILCCMLLFQTTAFAFFGSKDKYEKEKEEKQPMVHTVDEWLESAVNVKMDMRKRDEAKEDKDDKLIPPKPLPLYVEKYNVMPGSRELDLSKLYKNQMVRSIFVANPEFSYAAYTETYHYPQTKQIASTFFLIELDKHLGKKERLQDVSVFEHTRIPLISTAIPYLKDDFFSTLTLVDYSSDGKKILVKERRGSLKYGLYETYVWVYFLGDTDKNSNQCYMNNLDFANELLNYTTLDGKEDFSKPDFNFMPDENMNTNLKEEKELAKYGKDLKNLENVPDYTLTTYKLIKDDKKEELDNIKAGNKLGDINELTKKQDLNWLKEEITVVGKKNYGSNYDIDGADVPKLDYRNVKNFIKTVWKNDEMNSSYKNRWYNAVPIDFRVETPYEGRENIGYGVRLNLLNEMIRAYWFDRQNLILNHIRWDLNPLGFSANNPNEVIVLAWAYNKEGKKVSLGRWAVDLETGNPRLVMEDEEISIEANGLFLEGKLNPR